MILRVWFVLGMFACLMCSVFALFLCKFVG